MNFLSRTLTGVITIIVGVFICFGSISNISHDWPGLIWGIGFIIIGLFIFFNKKEDKIEEINNNKSLNKK